MRASSAIADEVFYLSDYIQLNPWYYLVVCKWKLGGRWRETITIEFII